MSLLAPTFCGGLLYGDPLIRPTAAQHTDPLPKPVLCVHRAGACDPEPDIDLAPPASPLSLPSSRLVRTAETLYFPSCQPTTASYLSSTTRIHMSLEP
jgi:hypothetical protein